MLPLADSCYPDGSPQTPHSSGIHTTLHPAHPSYSRSNPTGSGSRCFRVLWDSHSRAPVQTIAPPAWKLSRAPSLSAPILLPGSATPTRCALARPPSCPIRVFGTLTGLPTRCSGAQTATPAAPTTVQPASTLLTRCVPPASSFRPCPLGLTTWPPRHACGPPERPSGTTPTTQRCGNTHRSCWRRTLCYSALQVIRVRYVAHASGKGPPTSGKIPLKPSGTASASPSCAYPAGVAQRFCWGRR